MQQLDYFKILVGKSGLFDKNFYLFINQDVKKANMDPIVHYLVYGWREGRNPSPKFNTNLYLDAYPDVKKAGINPLLHYVLYGRNEGREIFGHVYTIHGFSFISYSEFNCERDDSLNGSEVLEFNYNDKTYKIIGFGARGIGTNGDMKIFLDDEYGFLNVNNKTVIDIGANIGDSAIYFLMMGAEKVISLEPYPYACNVMRKNLEINNLMHKVTLLNAGYGGDRIIKIDTEYKNHLGSPLKATSEGEEIEIHSLNTLVKQYNIEEGVLKIDCEGCEYYLLEEKEEILRKFKLIQIEYHYGYGELKTKLESSGFTVSITEPVYCLNNEWSPKDMYIGFIYATRN